MADDGLTRCSWAGPGSSDAMRAYHDREWGVPLHGDRALFEFLCLEGAQAGLSWRTVLDKRARYREVFHDFDIEQRRILQVAAAQGQRVAIRRSLSPERPNEPACTVVHDDRLP